MIGQTLKPGDVVVIGACEDWHEHHFLVQDVHDDCVTGFALDGPFEGGYGEPEHDLILRIID